MKSTKKRPTRTPRKYQLQVVMELDEDGKYVAWCPALKACYTQGDTFEEAMTNIRDVISMCLEDCARRPNRNDLRFLEVIGVRHVEVSV